MKGKNKLFLSSLLLLNMALLQACGSDRVFEEYKGMDSHLWALSDTVTFELDSLDTERAISTIGIRYNDNFEFHNLYVRYLLKDSLGLHLEDSLINIELFDAKTGKPLGKGFGNVFTKVDTLPHTGFSKNQFMKVHFIQYMRKDQVKGIEAVGLKIFKE